MTVLVTHRVDQPAGSYALNQVRTISPGFTKIAGDVHKALSICMLGTCHYQHLKQHAVIACDIQQCSKHRRYRGLGSSVVVMVRIPVLGRLFWYALYYCPPPASD